jgi:hypothetical protein
MDDMDDNDNTGLVSEAEAAEYAEGNGAYVLGAASGKLGAVGVVGLGVAAPTERRELDAPGLVRFLLAVSTRFARLFSSLVAMYRPDGTKSPVSSGMLSIVPSKSTVAWT